MARQLGVVLLSLGGLRADFILWGNESFFTTNYSLCYKERASRLLTNT